MVANGWRTQRRAGPGGPGRGPGDPSRGIVATFTGSHAHASLAAYSMGRPNHSPLPHAHFKIAAPDGREPAVAFGEGFYPEGVVYENSLVSHRRRRRWLPGETNLPYL